jgi:hypothetical protein
MTIATHTVSINPAFLQEIKDDHHELRQLMHHVAAMLDRPGWMHVEYGRLVELITKLRDQLALHFSLEEAYGYCDDALSAAPHLSRRSEQLRAQHDQLFANLCRLVDCAEQLLYHETANAALLRLAEEFRGFSAQLHEHEANECDLILEAFNNDIGAGD